MRSWILAAVVLAAVVVVGSLTSKRWTPWLKESLSSNFARSLMDHEHDDHDHGTAAGMSNDLKLSKQARKNLSLELKPLKLQTYVRSIEIPGTVVDRPGRSDRGVTSPAVGIVTEVHAFPGDTVSPGDRLFSLRLSSEYLQNAQKDLFNASSETKLIQEQLARLTGLADSGGVARSKLIDLENDLRRQAAAIRGHRQDLLTRGLSPEQVDAIATGNFVSTIDVLAPPAIKSGDQEMSRSTEETVRLVSHRTGMISYEFQDLDVELGQQVQAGQLLATLADHSSLLIKGHAFRRDAPFLETAAQHQWPVDVRFSEDDAIGWPVSHQSFEIRHFSNSIDPVSRTFDVFLPLNNQSRFYERNGESFIVWRYRPGQRVRLRIPVEQISDVFVVPASAIVREGPEAYVFRRKGFLLSRVAVHVVHEDRFDAVITNDGSLSTGQVIAQGSAAALNRALKAQSASGIDPGVHVHADGTVHGSKD
jgi:membrane fusion protein, heavy metal efflux system